MQQSSATQSLHLCFWGLRKIVACSHFSSQCLLVPTVFGTVSSLHPTLFLYLYTLFTTVFVITVITVVFIEQYVYTKFSLDWILCYYAHLCPYHNVWPEVVYLQLQCLLI